MGAGGGGGLWLKLFAIVVDSRLFLSWQVCSAHRPGNLARLSGRGGSDTGKVRPVDTSLFPSGEQGD